MKTQLFAGRSPAHPHRQLATRALVACATVLALALGLGAPRLEAAAIAPAPQPVQVLQGVSVSFSQLNWLGELPGQVAYPDSRVGVAELRFTSPASTYFVGQGAYVNITATIAGTKQWSVQNWFVRYPTIADMVASSPSVQFGMPITNGRDVSALRFILTVTKQVRTDGATLLPNTGATVVAANYRVGGINGGSGLSTLPVTLGPWIGGKVVTRAFAGPGLSTSSLGFVYSRAAGGDPVSETPNGCGPGSVARAINQMTGDDAQQAYEDLYGKMGTDPEIGTYVEDIVAGKNEYCEENGHDIDTGYSDWPDDGDLSGPSDAVDNGGAAEVIIDWAGGGGHAANVTSITPSADGGYQITYEDDADQTDGQPANDEHTIDVDAEGNFDGGSVRGFITETQGAATA